MLLRLLRPAGYRRWGWMLDLQGTESGKEKGR